jgi:peptide/nickel transport system substrate-binding protein
MMNNGLVLRLGRTIAAGAAALAVVGVAACTAGPGVLGGGGPSASASVSAAATALGPPVPGGTARVALPAGVTPDYIWPYTPTADAGEYNAEGFQQLMYRPLYMFGADDNSTVTVNYPLSPANAPVYSAGGTTVTVTLKGWKWSDGETVDASDVIFWLNLMRAEPRAFYGYVPGELPDNLLSYRAAGPDTVVLRLKSTVSEIWFTYDQLAEITPMPAAWDVTAVGAEAGSGGCVADTAADGWARCAAVYRFLSAQAADVKGYAATRLWGVVDGPWKLTAFTPASAGPVATFAPNPGYSGSPKPELSAVTYYAYPSPAAEYAALRSGRLDVGYIPSQDLPPAPDGSLPATSPLGTAFTLAPAYSAGIADIQLNYRSSALGPVYQQFYVRQSLQQMISRADMISSVDNGYGYAISGIVPAVPGNPWVPADQEANGGAGPYPFSAPAAAIMLAGHGWQAKDGVLTCETPGAGDGQCGAGIAAGAKLSMTLAYPAGNARLQAEAALVRSDFAADGVQLSLLQVPPAAGGGAPAPCPSAKAGQAGTPSCEWNLLLSPGGWNTGDIGFEPTGEQSLVTGGQFNLGGYSDPILNGYLAMVHADGSVQTFQNYASYVADQVPFLWLPAAYTVTATKVSLGGVDDGPLGTILPEYWFFAK